MIKRETVDEVLRRNDIESLIGSYVSLKRAGTNVKGLCPFHSEKTPSFTVFPQENSFYCFGCGVGGNAITFIRQIEHLDYPDAVEFLAKRAGITVMRDEKDDTHYTPKRYDKARFYKMNTDAAKFFHSYLFSDNPDAKAALRYFAEERQLSLATIKHFGLGFAPNDFDTFKSYMESKGYNRDELFEAYLYRKSEKGSYYPAFRNRVIFPVIDVAGNVVAFGGRVMDNSKPKYLNTSDTPVFKKLRNLFALNFARMTCQETLILCEGYMDVIALHAAGFTNAVATLGTAITQDQARLMSRYTKRVVICYDSDEAGQTAAVKAIRLLSDVGVEVKVLKVPGAKDPDEYIKTFGKEKFAQVISDSKSKFDYAVDKILSKYDLNLVDDKVRALGEITDLIADAYSSTERDIYIQTISANIGVDRDSLTKDVTKALQKRAKLYKKAESEKARENILGYQDKVNPDFAKAPAIAKSEELVLGLLLLYPNHRKVVFDEDLLTEDDFFTELNKRVFAFVKGVYFGDDFSYDRLDEDFDPGEVGRITKMKIARMELTENGDDVLRDAIASLKGGMYKKQAKATTTFEGLDALINKIRNKKD